MKSNRRKDMEYIVFWQSFWYLLAFVGTMPLLFVLTLGNVKLAQSYVFNVLVSFLGPIQGLNNALIYFRARFVKKTSATFRRGSEVVSNVRRRIPSSTRRQGASSQASDASVDFELNNLPQEYVDPNVAILSEFELDRPDDGDVKMMSSKASVLHSTSDQHQHVDGSMAIVSNSPIETQQLEVAGSDSFGMDHSAPAKFGASFMNSFKSNRNAKDRTMGASSPAITYPGIRHGTSSRIGLFNIFNADRNDPGADIAHNSISRMLSDSSLAGSPSSLYRDASPRNDAIILDSMIEDSTENRNPRSEEAMNNTPRFV